MALSGKLSAAYRGWTYRVQWTAAQNVDKNQSVITCKHYLDCASSYSLHIGTRDNVCKAGTDSKSFTSPKISTGGGSTITLGTTTHTVTHNNDGTLNLTLSGTFNIKATLSGTYKESLSVSGKITLDTIPRASQPSCITWPEHTQNVGEFGDTISIHMNRKSDSFTHTVRYRWSSSYGTKEGTIATGVGTGTTWKIPLDLMDVIPNNTSGTGTIYADTYKGTTLIGTKSVRFTVKVPASVKPSCSIQVLDATGTKDKYGNLVKGLSKLQVKTTGTPAYSSAIASYNVNANGAKYTAADITTDPLGTAGTTTVTATVTDKRGRTSAKASASFPVLDYTRPSITGLSVYRCDADGTENDQGDFVKVYFSASITSLNNKNTAAYTLQWKKSTDADYPSSNKKSWAGQYTLEDATHIFEADVDYAYDVQVSVADDIYTTVRTTSVSTGFTLMDWNDDGQSLAFGKVSEEPGGVLENALVFKQIANAYSFSSRGEAGTDGYVLMASIEITDLNSDTPITFVFSRRHAAAPMTVHVAFQGTNDMTPGLKSILYEGENYGAFLTQTTESIWDLYVQKVTANDEITLNRWHTSRRQMQRCALTFPGTLASSVPQGLQGWYRATPAKMQSLVDFIYPVGSIYLSYSHVSPATLFGGTWVRIENTFLWACDDKGEIGATGGEKTHTLTAAEIPAHTHRVKVAQDITGSINLEEPTIAYRNTNTKTNYTGTVSTEARGDGAAHNNMPPYIHVSAWRRTA